MENPIILNLEKWRMDLKTLANKTKHILQKAICSCNTHCHQGLFSSSLFAWIIQHLLECQMHTQYWKTNDEIRNEQLNWIFLKDREQSFHMEKKSIQARIHLPHIIFHSWEIASQSISITLNLHNDITHQSIQLKFNLSWARKVLLHFILLREYFHLY